MTAIALHLPSTSDAPFAVPSVIVLDLPAPPSVNRTRRIDWEGSRGARLWRDRAAPLVLWNRSKRKEQPRKILGRFELLLIISEAHTAIDLDNGIKVVIDYLKRIDAIQDDSPKYFRRLTVEFGEAPEGCRVHVRGIA